MSREYKLYLRDIRDSIEKIELYVQELDYPQFSGNDMVIDAVLRNFIVIGEAAKNIPDAIRAKYPDVPWRAIGSFRDLIAHEYFRVDLTETWSIIRERLPPLKAEIIEILDQEGDAGSS